MSKDYKGFTTDELILKLKNNLKAVKKLVPKVFRNYGLRNKLMLNKTAMFKKLPQCLNKQGIMGPDITLLENNKKYLKLDEEDFTLCTSDVSQDFSDLIESIQYLLWEINIRYANEELALGQLEFNMSNCEMPLESSIDDNDDELLSV